MRVVQCFRRQTLRHKKSPAARVEPGAGLFVARDKKLSATSGPEMARAKKEIKVIAPAQIHAAIVAAAATVCKRICEPAALPLHRVDHIAVQIAGC